MSFPTFTPAQARALLPRVRPLLADLRDAWHAHTFAREQWKELDSFGAGESEEALRWRRDAEAQGQRVQSIVDELVALGVDVKDPLLGLIDFYHRREDGSVVLLCYRDDEPDLGWWHPVETGFAGRRPLSEL
jgi:hypothetical protein